MTGFVLPMTQRGPAYLYAGTLPSKELFALTHAKSVRMREQRYERKLNEVPSAPV